MQINLHRSMSHHESPSRSNQIHWIHSELTNVNLLFPHLPRSTEVYWSLCFVNTFMTRRTCCDFCDFSDLRATSACFLAALSSTESGVWKVVYDLHWATTRVTQALIFFWEPCKNQIEIFDQRRLKRLFNLTFRPRIPHSWNETNKNITIFHNADSKWFQMVRNGSKLGPITRMLSVRWIQWVTSICKTKVKNDKTR